MYTLITSVDLRH